jgi:hypothetical protein
MKKQLILAIFSIFLYAEQSDINKTITDEDFMKQWQELEQREKEAKNKTERIQQEVIMLKQENIKLNQEHEKIKKTGKILDDITNQLKIDK